MKKQTTLHLKILLSGLVLNLSIAQPLAADFLELPQGVTEEPASTKGLLYGPEISGCQEISSGWQTDKPDFTDYVKREMASAAKTVNELINQKAPNLKRFLKKKNITTFVNLNTGQINPNNITFQGKIESNTYYILSESASSEIMKVKDRIDCAVGQELLTAEGSCYKFNNYEANLPKGEYIEEEEVRELLDSIDSIRTSYRKKLNTVTKKVAKCTALYSVVSNGPTNRQMDFKEFNKNQSEKSSDKKLTCNSSGYETQDYKACKEALTYYDAVFYSRAAVEAVQSLQYTDSSMDIQTEFAKNSQTDATAGLKAQQQDIKTQANMARTRAATETAALAALYKAMGDIPSLDDMVSECNAKIESLSTSDGIKETRKAYSTYYSQSLQSLGYTDATTTTAEEIMDANLVASCNEYIANVQNESHALIQNGNAKEVIEQALVDAGMNVVTMIGTAEILDKQAGRVGDAINSIDEYDPESLAYDSEDLLTTECAVDPGSENCVNAVYERGVGYQNDGISVSGMQFATSDSTLPIDEYSRSTDGASDPTDTSTSVGAIGSPINSIDKGTGLADSPLAAASVSSTGANGLGSGRGGGGGGGGGASAPANGSASTGGQGAPSAYTGSSKKLSYSSGGGGLSFSSGSTRTTKKAKATNPFSSLFGKKTAKAEGVLNFRGVASEVGSKNGSIFQMISKRYSAVSKDERLEEYQKVNE